MKITVYIPDDATEFTASATIETDMAKSFIGITIDPRLFSEIHIPDPRKAKEDAK